MNNLIMLFIIVPVLAVLLLALNLIFSVKRPDGGKVSSYECGYEDFGGFTRSKFQIHFYVVAMLFLIFDLEILLLFPIAVAIYHVSSFGFTIAIIFFIVLTIGFILEIGAGAISISDSTLLIKKNINK